MFKDWNGLAEYIVKTYPDATDPKLDQEHWDLACDSDKCGGLVRGFNVVADAQNLRRTRYGDFENDPESIHTIFFQCPVCKEYRAWLGYWVSIIEEREGKNYSVKRFFRVASLPNEHEDIAALPDDPPALRTAYVQAVKALNAGAYIPAAVMFRRALQVLLRDVLKVQAKNDKLSEELKAAVGMSYDGVTLTDAFFKDAHLLKKAGDQGAHPDEDPDLLDFTEQDARDLQFIFRRLVGEMFEVPQAIRRVRENLVTSRKVTTPNA